MALIDDRGREKLKKMLAGMTKPVRLVNFSQDFECHLCRETRTLVSEMATVNELLSFESYDFSADKEAVQLFGIDKIPATAVVGETDHGIRFYGIPAGYEMAGFIEAILRVSSGDPGLTPATREALKALTRPVHLQVFVTPTCPYCPGAVSLAHRMAMGSNLVRADMFEVSEFPHLGQKYSVRGVPLTVINETESLTGAVPESVLLEKILAAGK